MRIAQQQRHHRTMNARAEREKWSRLVLLRQPEPSLTNLSKVRRASLGRRRRLGTVVSQTWLSVNLRPMDWLT